MSLQFLASSVLGPLWSFAPKLLPMSSVSGFTFAKFSKVSTTLRPRTRRPLILATAWVGFRMLPTWLRFSCSLCAFFEIWGGEVAVCEVFVKDATASGRAEGRSPFAAPAGGGKDDDLNRVASRAAPSRARFCSQAFATSLAHALQDGRGNLAEPFNLALLWMVRCRLLKMPHPQSPDKVARSRGAPRHVLRFQWGRP